MCFDSNMIFAQYGGVVPAGGGKEVDQPQRALPVAAQEAAAERLALAVPATAGFQPHLYRPSHQCTSPTCTHLSELALTTSVHVIYLLAYPYLLNSAPTHFCTSFTFFA